MSGQVFTRDELRQMVARCIESVHLLNDWEQNFIASMDERLDSGQFMSEAMTDKIDQIYQKVP